MLFRSKSDAEKKLTPAIVARISRYGLDPFKLARDPQQWRNLKGSIARVLGGHSWIDYSLDCWRALRSHIFLAIEPSNAEVVFDAFDRIAPLHQRKIS